MNRRTLILLVIAGVLLVVVYLVLQKPGEQSAGPDTRGALVNVDSAAVDRIEVGVPDNAVVLEKRDGEWFLTRPITYRADQAAVASFLHDVKTLNVKGVVSNRSEKRSMFEVDSAGTHVRLSSSGRELAAFVVGKMAGSYLERYARLESSSDVVLVEGTSYTEFKKPLRDWRDRRLFTQRREQVAGVIFQYGDTTFALRLRDSVWIIDGKLAQVDAVNRFLSALSSLEADAFVDSTLSPAPRATAQITIGNTQLRFAYQKKTEKYLVQTSSSPQWYVLESWRSNQVLLRKRDFTAAKN